MLPSGPKTNKLSQNIQFISNPIAVLEENRRIYGKTFLIRLLSHPQCVVISDPVDIKQVFMDSTNKLCTGEVNALLFRPILGDGSVLNLDGKEHLFHRKLLLPSFQGERMQVYGELMAETAKKRILQWKKGEAFPLLEEARDITFSVILKAIFGMDESSEHFNALHKSLHAFIQEIIKPFSLMTLLNPFLHFNLGPLTPWAKMMKLRKQVDKYLFAEIEARKKINLESRTDILSLLLKTRDENGKALTDKEIRDEMLTLLMAGHDTSTMGISWAMYGILSNESVLKKLKEELQTILVHKEDLVSQLDKLMYLDAVIKEALRITPVVPYVTRLTKETYQLGEYTLPKDTIIMPSIYLAHRDANLWSEPEKFMPERFLNSSETPYSFLPFGGGIRRCIGAAFAQYEMKIIIAQMLLHTHLSLLKNYVPKPERKGVVLAPSGGLPVILTEFC